jgi:hypothetical protein
VSAGTLATKRIWAHFNQPVKPEPDESISTAPPPCGTAPAITAQQIGRTIPTSKERNEKSNILCMQLARRGLHH